MNVDKVSVCTRHFYVGKVLVLMALLLGHSVSAETSLSKTCWKLHLCVDVLVTRSFSPVIGYPLLKSLTV